VSGGLPVGKRTCGGLPPPSDKGVALVPGGRGRKPKIMTGCSVHRRRRRVGCGFGERYLDRGRPRRRQRRGGQITGLSGAVEAFTR
jgi:hypothetical protein